MGDRNYRHDPFAGVYIDIGDKRISRSCGGIRAGVSSAFHEQNHSLLAASAAALLAASLFWRFEFEVSALLEQRMGAALRRPHGTIINAIKLFLLGIVGYLLVRALNFVFFGLAFRSNESTRRR